MAREEGNGNTVQVYHDRTWKHQRRTEEVYNGTQNVTGTIRHELMMLMHIFYISTDTVVVAVSYLLMAVVVGR